MDCFVTAVSLALQDTMLRKALCDRSTHARFEPERVEQESAVQYAQSLTDYVARKLARKFLLRTSPAQTGAGAEVTLSAPAYLIRRRDGDGQTDAPACKDCGAIRT